MNEDDKRLRDALFTAHQDMTRIWGACEIKEELRLRKSKAFRDKVIAQRHELYPDYTDKEFDGLLKALED